MSRIIAIAASLALVALVSISIVGRYTMSTPDFYEDFSQPLDPAKWMVSNWQAPGNDDNHASVSRDDNVRVEGGYLVLELNQYSMDVSTVDPALTLTNTFSIGGEVRTIDSFGYGIYSMRVRASSTSPTPTGIGSAVSGSITGIFNWITDSETEIDIEVEGVRPEQTQTTTWNNVNNPNEHQDFVLSGPQPHEVFYEYTIDWEPTRVRFYRDGVLFSTHTAVVPSDPAPFFFNHWGTDSEWWGGYPTANTPRYVYVDWFSFTAH